MGTILGRKCYRPQMANASALLDRLELLARLESHRLPGRNRNLRPGPRVTANSGLARPHVEHAKPPQLDAVPLGERTLHAFKYCFHRHFGLGLGDTSPIHYLINNVKLDHVRLATSAVFLGFPSD